MTENKILQFPKIPTAPTEEGDTTAKVLSLPTPDCSQDRPRPLRLLPLRHLVAADRLQDDHDPTEPPPENVLPLDMALAQFQALLFDYEAQTQFHGDMLAARRQGKLEAPDPDVVRAIRDQFAEEVDAIDYRLMIRNFEEGDLTDSTKVSITRPEEHIRMLQLSGSSPDHPVITLTHTNLTAEGDSMVVARLHVTRNAFEAFPEGGVSFEVQGQSMLRSLLDQTRLLRTRLCREFFDEEQ